MWFVLMIIAVIIIYNLIKEKKMRERIAEIQQIKMEEHKKEREKAEAEERRLERLRKWEQEKQAKAKEAKKKIKEFTFDEAVDFYFRTNHYSCRSEYDYKRYFTDAFNCILNNIKSYEIVLSDEKVLRQGEAVNPITEFKNITKATKRNSVKDFVAIDTETTGLKCGGNDIIEICAIKFLDFVPSEKFHTYLKPRKSIPSETSAINGITDSMVENAPKFSQIKSCLQEFIGDLPLVAHNARFDMKFLHVSGLNLENHIGKVYDTLHLARLKMKGEDSYKLEDLCYSANIGCADFHSADSDTLACGILFIDIIKEVKEVTSIDNL